MRTQRAELCKVPRHSVVCEEVFASPLKPFTEAELADELARVPRLVSPRSAATRRPIRDKLRPMHDRPQEYRPHPWHGVDPGKRFPEIVRAYIEIVPTDGVKYEIDKHSGYLMVDRPAALLELLSDAVRICPTHVLRRSGCSVCTRGQPARLSGRRRPARYLCADGPAHFAW